MDSSTITIIIIIGVIIWLLLTIFGIKLCNKNNALGILLLFISLNIFGLILGCCLLYNKRK